MDYVQLAAKIDVCKAFGWENRFGCILEPKMLIILGLNYEIFGFHVEIEIIQPDCWSRIYARIRACLRALKRHRQGP